VKKKKAGLRKINVPSPGRGRLMEGGKKGLFLGKRTIFFLVRGEKTPKCLLNHGSRGKEGD